MAVQHTGNKKRTLRWNRFRADDAIDRDLSWYESTVALITRAGSELKNRPDAVLREQADMLKKKVQKGTALDAIVVDAFALAREAASRVLDMRPYDVQLMAGLGLHKGKLIEMYTGEGKTLAAVLPAFLHALTGLGVHILTFNDYLARRDAEWMGPLYAYLGIRVDAVQEGMAVDRRKKAYQADVTYITAKEAGFDYLRMHLARTVEDRVHRPFNFAIVDEADSILIDEARVPLVIAGNREKSNANPYRIAEVVRALTAGKDWEVDEFKRNVQLTGAGVDRVEAAFVCGKLHAQKNYLLLTEVNQALHAQVLLHRGVDYIVRDDRIEIVDVFTGRIVDDRRWPDGLQEALEAKEGLPIQPGGKILGSIALQNFLRLYPHLSGMTATATSAAREIADFYGLRVLPIPQNKQSIREDLPLLVFTHLEAKYQALTHAIKSAHKKGRPALVGTNSVNESEYLASRIRREDIPCQILNAKNDEEEARVIALAGMPGAVTISTNMAGRGTDIKLGGKDERHRERVVAVGGLLVLGTNLNESRRIDNQLKGRAGRQGDPGSTQFFVSIEDHLMQTFGIKELIPERFFPEHQKQPITNPVILKEVERIQRIVEGQNYEIRKTMWKYAQLIEKQRQRLITWRDAIVLKQADLTVFESRLNARFNAICQAYGAETAYEAERVVTLHVIDKVWADHLAHIAHIRDGIHLLGIGGLNPLFEFQKQAATAFLTLFETIEEQTGELLASISIDEKGVDTEAAGLQGPSSTWTYLVNDKVLNDLQQMLFGYGSSAFVGLGGLLTWPLLLIWGISERWKQRRR